MADKFSWYKLYNFYFDCDNQDVNTTVAEANNTEVETVRADKAVIEAALEAARE